MPTYKKDPRIKYVDMAIFIDNEIYKENCDETKCFEYMYHLFYVLAVKKKMFLTAFDYDSYALYGATQLLMRYRKNRDKNSKLKPIKSCLNYIKRVLYPFKVNYQKTSFGQIFPIEDIETGDLTGMSDERINAVRGYNRGLLQFEYQYYLTQINSTIKEVLKESPYVNDPVTFRNLHLSCLLTLLKTITLSNKNKKRIENKEDRNLPVLILMDKIYEEESKDNVVVYHLDKSMGNYVRTLVNRCKHEIAKDLSTIIGSHELPDDIVEDILKQPLGELTDGNKNAE